jgi:dsRNA-specific ribonuclease
MFTIRLCLGEKEYIGVDRSIKLAQRAAAQIALDDHNHRPSIDNHNQNISPSNNVSQSPTVILNTWAIQHHILIQYVLLNEEFLPYYRLYIGHDLYFDGHGSSHQQARISCACQALNLLDQNQIPIMISTSPQVNLLQI